MASRALLVAELRYRLERDSRPRVTVALIVAGAGLAAFVTSFVALRAGLDSMGLRYGLAALAGYLAFLGLVRAWIASRRGWPPNHDLGVDIADAPVTTGSRHGRAPADHAWDAPDAGSWVDFDEGFVVVVVVLLLVLGGVLAMAFVIHAAPVLLAEVALDAALVSSIYRRLERRDAGWWAGAVVRQTGAPAAVVIGFATLCGFIFEQLAPGAHSIGEVLASLLSR